MRIITVENQSSLTPQEIQDITVALSEQALSDFNTSPWVEHGYVSPIHVISLLGAPPAGSWNLIFLNNLPGAGEGALGYHEDINGTKIPVSYIGVKECREDGVAISEVASHELVEMAVDPYVNGNEAKFVSYAGKNYILEIADPVQNCGYTIAGQTVADFVWPRFFRMAQTRLAYSQRQSVMAPLTLAPDGYMSIRTPGQEWHQIFGEKRASLPKFSERLSRAGVPEVIKYRNQTTIGDAIKTARSAIS